MKAGRSASSSAHSQSKSKYSTRYVLLIISGFTICWCIFIAIKLNHPKQTGVGNDANKTYKRSSITITEQKLITAIPIIVSEVREEIVSSPESVKSNDSDGAIHVAFSTDCTFYQDWQTLVVFHSAVEVGQKGSITRIASGCSKGKQGRLTKLYAELFPQYHVHFTPDFKTDKKTSESYDFYNKPFGVEHWLEFADPPVLDNTVIAIIDPDMIFIRPLTTAIQEDNTILLPGSTNIPETIGKGVPAGQQYGLGAPWATRTSKNFNRTAVCGENSPCLDVEQRFGERHFRVYEGYPELLAEMYAYSMAAAHEKLPHFAMTHYMVSNTFADDEGWRWVDALGDDVCTHPVKSGPESADPQTGIRQSSYYPGKPLPTFLHMCQFFRAGEFGFHKKRLKEELMSCGFQMLADPPTDLGKVNYKNRDGEIIALSRTNARRNAFSICVAHRSINAMLEYYKRIECEPSSIVTNKSINVVNWPT